ncbi:hypothetical protein [Flavobacterium caeni]|uniref:hypothetical protein n=1 Tax=Flavobacterium caeni TaxID=490189 RepID=UPI000B81245A|nr:hypothetical protein [Flavobacterium caeni]
MKNINYKNGQTLWNGETLFYSNGKLAWHQNMGYYPNGQVASAGFNGFWKNGERAWEGNQAYDEDGSHMGGIGVALILNRIFVLLVSANEVAIDINRGTKRFTLIKK